MSGATSPEAETIIRQTQQINTLMDQSARGINKLQGELDRAWAAQQKFERAQVQINAAVERGLRTRDEGNRLLEQARQRLEATATAQQRLASANDNASRGTRNFGAVIGQAGFQVQDFAVQVASGQSALTALVQQGSQLLGVFGTGGAIAGAVLAVGGIAAQFFLAGDNAKRLGELAGEATGSVISGNREWANTLREINDLYLTAAERAAVAANAARQLLLDQARARSGAITMQQEELGSRQGSAQIRLDDANRALVEWQRLNPGAATARPGSLMANRLHQLQRQQQQAQSAFDQVLNEQGRLSRAQGEAAEAERRAENAGTIGAEEYGPNAPRRRSSGGRGAEQTRDQLTQQRSAFVAAVDPMERYLQALDRIDQLNAQLARVGVDPLPEEAVLRAQEEALRQYNAALEGTRQQTEQLGQAGKDLQVITNGLGDAINQAFEGLIFGGKSANDVLKQLEQQLLRLGNQYLLAPLFQQGVGYLFGGGQGGKDSGTGSGSSGLLSGLISGIGGLLGGGAVGGLKGSADAAIAAGTMVSFAHQGGVIGDPVLPRRPVPAEVFLDAPRYHRGGVAGQVPGLAPNEVPAVLERGELVLTQQQQRTALDRGSSIVMNVYAADPGAFNKSRSQVERDLRRGLARARRNS